MGENTKIMLTFAKTIIYITNINHNYHMKRIVMGLAGFALALTAINGANPKSEFRGAWMHTVFQGQYAKQNTEQNKKYLRRQLDSLQMAGINAIVFQVRPSADAFYASKYEPWSRFLTKNGAAPKPYWDPLQFMIDESHARGMELHAWLNPYRVTTSKGEKLAPNHIYHKHPERFVAYDGKLYFDPGLPENRRFIEDVVRDIVTNYDVDAIHMDDYFYPYPVANEAFPDDQSYAKYGNGMDRGDWRRQNVDMLIEGLHNVIQGTKPWVRLGISPFGVWRNESTDPRGSKTKALQNYDDLYADVLLWTEKGWVDYMLPQLYWEIEHKRAPYPVLVEWWAGVNNGRHMYVGQDVVKCMTKKDIAPSTRPNQLGTRIELARKQPTIHGNCWWPGYSITRNVGGVCDSLANNYQSTIALVPAYTWMTDKTPSAPTNIAFDRSTNTLTWQSATAPAGKVEDTPKFVVYSLPAGVDADKAVADAANIEAVVYGTTWSVPRGMSGAVVVTALDRANNESQPSAKIKIGK